MGAEREEYRTRMGAELRSRIDTLDGSGESNDALWPAAGRFLRGLEVLCRGGHGFHLGGRRNAHVYYGDAFLLYVRVEGIEERRPSLLLSDRAHGALKIGALDASHLLFRERIHGVIAALGLEHDKRLMRTRDGYRAIAGLPEAFFQLLQAQLIDIVQRGEQAQFQAQAPLFQLPKAKKRRRSSPLQKSPALKERAAELDRHMDAFKGLLSARIGAPVDITFGDGGVVVSWKEQSTAMQQAAWTFVDVVQSLTEAESTNPT